MKKFTLRNKTNESLDNQIKIWEKTIDVQMHFNELQMKIRNFSVLLISAFVGVAGIALKDRLTFEYGFLGYQFQGNLSAICFGAAAIAWLAFFFMDQFWYYPLLIGAVKHGAAIEDSLKDKLPLLGLTTRIGEESPQEFLRITLRSKGKSTVFYIGIFILLLILAIGSNGVPSESKSTKQPSSEAAGKPNASLSQTVQPTQQSVVPSAPNGGTTVILNQELYNGTNSPASTPTKRVKTTIDGQKQTIEKCGSLQPVCQ